MALTGGGSFLDGCCCEVADASAALEFPVCCPVDVLGGKLGLDGNFGGAGLASRSMTGGLRTFGADLVDSNGALAVGLADAFSSFAFSSNSLLVGGKGGSFAWSKVGGRFRGPSFEETLVFEDTVWPSDMPDMVEL